MKFCKWVRSGSLLLVAGMLLAVGCSDDDSDTPMTPEVGTGFVRVAHLSPDAPAVDVMVDGSRVLSGVTFGQFSGYLDLEAGSHRVQVLAAGTSTAVIDATITVAEERYSTVAATGALAQIAATVFEDDPTTAGNAARIRFIHAGADAPAVDITLTDGTPLFEDVSFREASGYLQTPGASYDLQVRAAGTETVVLSFDDVPLNDGTTYSVFATGLISDGSLRATVAVDAPGDGSTTLLLSPASASLRVAHLSPDAPEVDVYLDGVAVPALTSVPFLAVSGYLDVSAATHSVQVFVAGTTTDPVIDANLTLLPGSSTTVAATGLVGSGDLSPIVLSDDRDGQDGQAHVRFVHSSPDAPPVDVAVAEGPTLFSNVPFRGFAGYGPVAPGTYDLEVRLAEGGAVALPLSGVELDGGVNYTVFAVGLAADGSLDALVALDTP